MTSPVTCTWCGCGCGCGPPVDGSCGFCKIPVGMTDTLFCHMRYEKKSSCKNIAKCTEPVVKEMSLKWLGGGGGGGGELCNVCEVDDGGNR